MIERINDNAYKLGCPNKYNMTAGFNVDEDSRKNIFQNGENDENHVAKLYKIC